MEQDPVEQVTAIGAIHPDAAQFLAGSPQAFEQAFGSGRIGKCCSGDQHGHQQAERVNQNLPLASFHVFAGIVATFKSSLARFDALAIQSSCRRVFMATGTLSHLSTKRVMQSLPGAIITPVSKVGLHTLPGRILPRQHPPLATGYQQIHDRIDHRSHL